MSEAKTIDESNDDDRLLSNFLDESETPAAVTNFAGEPLELWRMTASATGPSCKEGAEILNQVFPLVYWFCHQVTIQNPERGSVKTVRTVLVDAQGNTYGFVSGGVYDSLRLLVQTLGPGPYDPPIPITVVAREKKGGRKFYAIEPAPQRISKSEKK